MRVLRVLEQRNAVVTEKDGRFCHKTADGGEMCHDTQAEAEAMVARQSRGRALKAGRDGQVKIETAQFQGREHLVVPVVALVEGVIQASNASTPELVLAEEFERNVAGWNGRPVMLNHPTWGAGPVAANDPRVLDESQIGTVFNARVEGGKLKMDAYVDPARLETMGEPGQKMLAAIRAGEMLEVSVGTVVEATPENGKVGGKPYTAVWREINSDHLAFLPEGVKGACSVEMGCGTRVAKVETARAAGCGCGGQGSHHASAEDRSMDKKARVAALIASGKTCFKAADAAVLEQLSDEAIADMETKLAAFPPKKDETPEEKKKRMEEEKAKYMAEVLENPDIKALVEASKLTPEQRKEAFLKENTDIAEIVTKHKTAAAARRAELVGKLKVAQTAYKEDELQALPSDQLEKLASIVVKEKPSYEGQIPRAAAQGDEGEVPPAPSMKARILEMRGLKAQA